MGKPRSSDRTYIRRAGIDISDAETLYHPGGFPRLGLSPVGVELSTRSTTLLAKQLRSNEKSRGHKLIVANLEKIDPRFANELVSTYLALAQRYPSVYLGVLDFSANMDNLGTMSEPKWYYKTLHETAREIGSGDLREVLDYLSERRDIRSFALRTELLQLGPYRWDIDLTSQGIIRLGQWTSVPSKYATLSAFPAARNLRKNQHGLRDSYIASLASEGSDTLIHEYGHLVDIALSDLGKEAEEHVYEALDRAIMRRPGGKYVIPASTLRKWKLTRRDTKLVNYPPSRIRQDPQKRSDLVRLVGAEIEFVLNLYSAQNRDELFAEAFLTAHTAKDPALRERLAPMLEALYDVGLRVKRRTA